MAELETAFHKLLGRQPSERETERLHRIKDALGLHDNDALWLVLMALESYDLLYRKYPEQIGEQVRKTVEQQRERIVAIADAEARKAQLVLAEAVVRTSEHIADHRFRLLSLQAWGAALIGITGFAALCILLGYVLGSGRMPFWARLSADQTFIALLISTIARTPIGLLLPLVTAAAGAMAIFLRKTETNSYWWSSPGRFALLTIAIVALVWLTLK